MTLYVSKYDSNVLDTRNSTFIKNLKIWVFWYFLKAEKKLYFYEFEIKLGPNSRNAIASPTAEKHVLAGNYCLYTTN